MTEIKSCDDDKLQLHSDSDEMQKQLDTLKSKINALEASSENNWQRNVAQTLFVLVDQQSHTLKEFNHLKKAIDLLTLQLFKVENTVRKS